MTQITDYNFPAPEVAPLESNTPPAYTPSENADDAGPAEKAASYPTAAEEKRGLLNVTSRESLPPTYTSNFRAPAATANITELARSIAVPTIKNNLTSGFPYPPMLDDYDVSSQEWEKFTSEITKGAQMQGGDWAASIAGGVGTFFVAATFMGGFAVIPAFCVGNHVRRKRENNNLDDSMRNGALEATIEHWNREFFTARGLVVRIEAPGMGPALDGAQMYLPHGKIDPFQDGASFGRKRRGCGGGGRQNKRAAKQAFLIRKYQAKIQERGRILIMPLSQTAQKEV
ncbi:MAG: hypothetical protein M4579_003318 [Chaenotheca gracillima]|nr:MAG: hypothetical protein M4579_003318 [Chaenotheca gracillima]